MPQLHHLTWSPFYLRRALPSCKGYLPYRLYWRRHFLLHCFQTRRMRMEKRNQSWNNQNMKWTMSKHLILLLKGVTSSMHNYSQHHLPLLLVLFHLFHPLLLLPLLLLRRRHLLRLAIVILPILSPQMCHPSAATTTTSISISDL